MFSMVDAHSTNVLHILVLLGVYILNTTATFFACSINPEKNIFFSSLWCLTVQNEGGAWSGCHGYNTCFRARQSMLTRSTRPSGPTGTPASGCRHSAIQAHTCRGHHGGSPAQVTVHDLIQSLKKKFWEIPSSMQFV